MSNVAFEVQQDLRNAALQLEESRLANQEFHLALTFGQWERASQASEMVVERMRANLDLLLAAHRKMAERD